MITKISQEFESDGNEFESLGSGLSAMQPRSGHPVNKLHRAPVASRGFGSSTRLVGSTDYFDIPSATDEPNHPLFSFFGDRYS
jgi:hypothetical protein